VRFRGARSGSCENGSSNTALRLMPTGIEHADTNRSLPLSRLRERMIKIDEVKPLDAFWLRLTFSDGAVMDVDVSDVVGRGGVFAPIADRAVFTKVRVNPDTRTIEWPGDVDLDPDVLYGTHEPASGVRIIRRVVTDAGTPG
jgi:hypothetical protein